MASPKVDLSEFFKLSRPKRPPCRVGFAISQLKGDAVTQIEAALAEDQGIITNAAISQWLDGRGYEVNVSAIVSHRKRTCTCKRDA